MKLLATLFVLTTLSVGWISHTKTQRVLDRELISAVREDRTETALLLLSQGADPNIRDIRDEQRSVWEQMKFIFRKHTFQDDRIEDHNSPTLLQMVSNHKSENAPLFTALLDAGASANYCSCGRWTPLMEAVRNGWVKSVRALLDHGADPLARDEKGRSPIFYLLTNNPDGPRIAEMLISRGNDVNAVDNVGITPLMRNIMDGGDGASTVRYLIEQGADVDVRGQGVSLLLMAARVQDSQKVQALLDRGADVNVSTPASQCTPLHYATYKTWSCCEWVVDKDTLPIVKMLLAHGAKVDSVDKDGNTPLLSCLESHDRPDIIKLLIQYGADVDHRNKAGDTALALARRGNFTTTIALLKAAGAK